MHILSVSGQLWCYLVAKNVIGTVFIGISQFS